MDVTASRIDQTVTLGAPVTGLTEANQAAAPLLSEGEYLVQSSPTSFAVVRGRTGAIASRVVEGESYAVVARDSGISTERVRQLCAPYMTPEVRNLRKARLDATRRETAVLKRAARPATTPRAVKPTYTDEECFAALRRAAGPDGQTPVSMGAYKRANAGSAAPADYTLVVRFGSWADACAAAGVLPGAVPQREYSTAWSDVDLRAWVYRFFDEVGLDPLPTMHGFKEWAAHQPGKAPSPITVRNRLGRWSELVAAYASGR